LLEYQPDRKDFIYCIISYNKPLVKYIHNVYQFHFKSKIFDFGYRVVEYFKCNKCLKSYNKYLTSIGIYPHGLYGSTFASKQTEKFVSCKCGNCDKIKRIDRRVNVEIIEK